MRMSGPMRTTIMSFATMLAETNAGVTTLGHDVGQAIVDDELHLDVGVLRRQLRQGGPEDEVGGMLARGDGAGGLLTQHKPRDIYEPDLHQGEGANFP